MNLVKPLLKFLNISLVKIKRPVGRPRASDRLLGAILELDWTVRPDLRKISDITEKLLRTDEFKDRDPKWLYQQVSNTIKSLTSEGPEYRGKIERWKRELVIDVLIKKAQDRKKKSTPDNSEL
jgi:hypothetical protein